MRRRLQPGYTLIELMVVVILIAVITGLAVPQINQAARSAAQADATNEIAVVFRKARASAARTNLAHRVAISSPTAAAGLQVVRLDRSPTTNDCLTLPACNDTPPGFGGPDCGIEVVQFSDPYYQRNAIKISSNAVSIGAGRRVNEAMSFCVTPMGRVFYSTPGGGGAPAGRVPTTGPVVVTVNRWASGYTGPPIGVKRCVLLAERSMPRIATGAACP